MRIQYVLMQWAMLAGIYAAPASALEQSTWQVGDYQVQLQASGESIFDANDCIRVRKGAKELYKKCEGRLKLGTSATPLTNITDLTGDQIPDLLFTSYTGGAHCCWTLYLVQLGDEVREVQTLELAHSEGVQLHNIDADAALELTGFADWAYAYKYVGFASSFARTSVWQPVGDHFELDTSSLIEPALSSAEFKLQVQAFKASEEMSYGALPNALIWTALKLATAGHLAQAKALVQQSQPKGQTMAAATLFLSLLDTALYESPWWREYLYLNLSSAIREQRDAIIHVPSGVVVGRSDGSQLQFAIGVRPAHDSNYFSYQSGQVELHKVASTTQRIGQVTVASQPDSQGQPQFKLQQMPASAVAKTFTMDHVRAVRARHDALLASVPNTVGEHPLAAELAKPLLGNCRVAQLSVVTDRVLGKLYPNLAIQLPDRPRILLPWGANLEYLSCGKEQPTLVGILTCRAQGYCGQLLVAQP